MMRIRTLNSLSLPYNKFNNKYSDSLLRVQKGGDGMVSPVRFVTCENSEQYIWERYLSWENEAIVYKRLKKIYQSQKVEHPERAAFKNTPSIIYYIKQARAIFLKSRDIDLWLDPLCLYYGMMSLMKALVLTVDIDYPRQTSILRHGLSTRKRKKSQYQFLFDEMKIQKNGLLPHITRLFNHPIPAGTTFTPEELLGMIPELQESYQEVTGKTTLFPIQIHSTPADSEPLGMLFSLEPLVLDRLHLPFARFVEHLNQANSHSFFQAEPSIQHQNQLFLRWQHPQADHVLNWEYGFQHPYFYENSKGDYFLWLGNNHLTYPIPEWWAHYLLLFLMSMLCRYDIPLWGEILFTAKESVLIEPLLRIVKRKFPHLLLHLLEEEKVILLLG